MATDILGAIGAQDSDFALLHTYGVRTIYDGLAQILGNHNEDMEIAERLFVEGTTHMPQDVYKLPGTGRLQELNSTTRAAEVKTANQWDVGYPLKNLGAAVATDDVTWAYMDAREFNRYIDTVLMQDTNTRRYEMLRALFNSTSRPYIDPRFKGLNSQGITVRPLANNDSTIYPPTIGTEVNTGPVNNYLGVATPLANLATWTQAQNPLPAAVNALEQYFGIPTGGSDIVTFINGGSAGQLGPIQNLPGFNLVANRFLTLGTNVTHVEAGNVPVNLGRVVGESDGTIINRWDWIPAGYMLTIHFGAPRPLMKRVDTPESGLTTGLKLKWASDQESPFLKWEWWNRYGFGVGNRLNGVITDLTTGGSNYTTPLQYA